MSIVVIVGPGRGGAIDARQSARNTGGHIRERARSIVVPDLGYEITGPSVWISRDQEIKISIVVEIRGCDWSSSGRIYLGSQRPSLRRFIALIDSNTEPCCRNQLGLTIVVEINSDSVTSILSRINIMMVAK